MAIKNKEDKEIVEVKVGEFAKKVGEIMLLARGAMTEEEEIIPKGREVRITKAIHVSNKTSWYSYLDTSKNEWVTEKIKLKGNPEEYFEIEEMFPENGNSKIAYVKRIQVKEFGKKFYPGGVQKCENRFRREEQRNASLDMDLPKKKRQNSSITDVRGVETRLSQGLSIYKPSSTQTKI